MRYLAFHKIAIQLFISIFSLCASSLVQASFETPITISPSGPILVQDNQVIGVNINWSGSSESDGLIVPFGSAHRIFSNSGIFSDSQGSFSIVNSRRVAKSVISVINNQEVPFTVRERLQIPRSVFFGVRKNSSTQLQYTRTFVDESGGSTPSITATVIFQVTNSSSGVLSVSQIDLRFSTNNLTAVVRVNETLSAYAKISHAGSGIFDAVWEIATPASTSGTPVFTTIATVRKLLAAGRNVFIESPSLPTNLTGNYLLRLRTQSPDTDFNILQLRYTVLPTNKPVVAVKKLYLINPINNSVVTGDTIFNWEPIKEAVAYQLEIVAADSVELPVLNYSSPSSSDSTEKKPVSAGVLMSSEQQVSKLTKLVLEHLKSGRAYQWRTIAIDNNGNIIGKSEYRLIKIK
jgi:hypothetical protein